MDVVYFVRDTRHESFRRVLYFYLSDFLSPSDIMRLTTEYLIYRVCASKQNLQSPVVSNVVGES